VGAEVKKRKAIALVSMLLMAALVLGSGQLYAQGGMGAQTDTGTPGGMGAQTDTIPPGGAVWQGGMSWTPQDSAVLYSAAGVDAQAVPVPGGTPDYFGSYPNYANSPLPEVVTADASTFYFAEGTLRPNFTPYLCIENAGTAGADVTITYFKGDGTESTETLVVPKNSRTTVLPSAVLGTGDDVAHDFSSRVACTNGQPIVVERPMYFNYNGEWTGGHDVIGAISTAGTFYFAEGYTGPGFDEWVCVLNPGSTAAKLTFDFQTQEEGLKTITGHEVPAHTRVTFKVNDLLGPNYQNSLKLSSDQPVVAERPMYFNYSPGVLDWTGGHDVVGATAPAPAFYFAEGTTRPGFDAYLCIQNPESTDADVTITYMLGDGTAATEVLTVPANHRSTVFPRIRLGTANDVAHDFSAKVECTSGQLIVAERPMYFNYNGEWTGGHDVIGAYAPQAAFYFAEGTCRTNFIPYICIQNPSISDAKVTITYMKGDGTTAIQKLTVTTGTRTTVLPRDILGTGDDVAHDFSAKVECTNLQQIVVERPMYFNYNGEWTGGHNVIGFSFDASTSVVPGTGIRKFVDSLPGLTAANANNLGQYVPIAVPDTTTYAGCDYYEIELDEYTQQLHSDLPATTLRGYRQTNTTDPTINKFTYTGPMIVAQKDRPVRVKFTNHLPTGSGGDLFLPVDSTVMGAGMGPNGPPEMYTENRAVIHLHGGNTPWISDGTMHQWTTPAGETTSYPEGVSVQNVPDMDGGTEPQGTLTLYYTNQQSARLMFYHDHAYGITRLNVYAGEAAGYIVQDSAEKNLVDKKIIPADQIPLIIQDKTFVPDPAQLVAQDPTWNYGSKGKLWFPHVYMPNQNPYDPSGSNAMGRWDYGPWFWPPFTGLQNGPVPNPYYDPVNAPWEPPVIPGTPNPSIVPEAFMDTPMVNGTAYPYVQIAPKAYRFRVLNASNDRSINLQLYYAKSNDAMWDSNTGALYNAEAGEVNMVPAQPDVGLPDRWPTDGRDGGVPDPAAAGPNIIQIGNEGGFLPEVAELLNTPIGYEYDRRSITVLNVSNKTLFLGPAERADVIVDFSGVPDGSKLILYNDSPAPVPAFDSRYDYYTGDPDKTATGGAPTTQPGYGPNTRTVMQFQVSSSGKGGLTGFNLDTLKAALPAAYAQFQPKPLVPQAPYNAAFGTNYPSDAFARIADTSMSFFNGPLTGLTITNGGSGYTSAPGVAITGGGGSGATGTAKISGVTALNITNGGSGYTIVPGVTFTGGGGTGAAATAQISGVTGLAITTGGGGYTSAPTVTFTGGGGGSGAAATATVTNGVITGLTITNGGSGYTSNPTVGFTGGGGIGAAANATISLGVVTGLILTDPGYDYTSNPIVGFTGGGGGINAAADATASTGAVTSLILTSGGVNYTSSPTVAFSGGGGSGAAAVAVGVVMQMQPKAIQELFDPVYGRMNALLGVELPNTSINIQTTIPYYDFDPPTEVIPNSDSATPIGALADGTQIWKITHNGVDTHAIHWHMFNVQVINRVGWDGMIKPPEANELGWKETVRMNPLEDCIVALRPIIPDIPWDLPNSIRALNVTDPIGSTAGFTNIDPTNQPAPVTNHLINFGWEYVWHCHLLGHEENIMMRPMAIGVAPIAPSGLGAVDGASTVTLTWTDNSKNETNWTIQRATTAGGPWTTVAAVDSTTGPATGGTITYVDTPVAPPGTYYYQVIANNVIGDTTTYALPAVGYTNISVDSVPSGSTSVVVTP
jgi:FtsP/CotA-like multicopper oxidase with cupredoxin domain